MAWFKKKKNDVIDLTKDEIKIPKSVRERLMKKYSSSDYRDLTSKDSSSQNLESGGNALGFLGNMASSSETSHLTESSDVNIKDAIRKIDDFEFKLGSIQRRVDSILDRLEVAEKRLDRFDR